MNRRTGLRIRERREQIRVRHHTGALLGIERDLHKVIRGGEFGTVEFCEAFVEVELVGEQQTAVIRWAIPERILQKQIQRRAEIGNDFGGETGIKCRVFRNDFRVTQLEPVMKEILHLRARPHVGQHAFRLRLDLLARVQGALGGDFREFLVGHGIPQAE